jgi:hypothetical protein
MGVNEFEPKSLEERSRTPDSGIERPRTNKLAGIAAGMLGVFSLYKSHHLETPLDLTEFLTGSLLVAHSGLEFAKNLVINSSEDLYDSVFKAATYTGAVAMTGVCILIGNPLEDLGPEHLILYPITLRYYYNTYHLFR